MAGYREVAAVLLAASLLGQIAFAQHTPLDGVTHTARYFELVKRVGVAERSVIRPDEPYNQRQRRFRESGARSGLEQLGSSLSRFFDEIRSPDSQYPLLRHAVLEYSFLRPRQQSPENGCMYIMYIGELQWPFPAPLLADLLRVRVVNPISQPVRDLLTVALTRWGRDSIDTPQDGDEAARLARISEWVGELLVPTVAEVRYKRDRIVNQLVRASLDAKSVARLSDAATSGELAVRVGSLAVLARGGWVDDPRFFAQLLEDEAAEVRYGAFWGLMFMRGDRGLPTLRQYTGRVDMIARRLRQARASPTAEQIVEEVAAFDLAIGAEPLPKAALDMLSASTESPSILRASERAVPAPVGHRLGLDKQGETQEIPESTPSEDAPEESAEPVVDLFPP